MYRNDWTNRAGFFSAWRLPSSYPTVCFKKIPISPTLAVLRSLWNVVPSSGLRKFRHGISIVVVTLDAQRDKLDRRSSTKLTVPATVDGEFFVDLCLQHDSLAWIHLFNGSAVSAH